MFFKVKQISIINISINKNKLSASFNKNLTPNSRSVFHAGVFIQSFNNIFFNRIGILWGLRYPA